MHLGILNPKERQRLRKEQESYYLWAVIYSWPEFRKELGRRKVGTRQIYRDYSKSTFKEDGRGTFYPKIFPLCCRFVVASIIFRICLQDDLKSISRFSTVEFEISFCGEKLARNSKFRDRKRACVNKWKSRIHFNTGSPKYSSNRCAIFVIIVYLFFVDISSLW